ncbi:MAG: ribosome maturation factor RimP [Proteobacteria bacterium]|nr:ribosome maturation factor RimP [Pseudomonadota bacterium]
MTEKKGLESFRKQLEPLLFEMGYSCVRMILKGGSSPLLQIMIERNDDVSVSVSDCTRVTKKILSLLEENDPIGGDYNIEVSSPGADRPLIKPEDFERFSGSLIQVTLFQEEGGRKKIEGKNLGVLEDILMLEVNQEPDAKKSVLNISLSNIRKANLKPLF